MRVSINHNRTTKEEASQPNYPKIECAFHPGQIITNFCTSEQCLLPLCPACVKIHTNQHVNLKRSTPEYEAINDLLEEIYEEVGQEMDKTDSCCQRINSFENRMKEQKNIINEKINNLKTEIISEIQQYFVDLKDSITERISNSLSYSKLVSQFKDESKKVMIALQNIEKSFNTQNSKLMRLVIKYKAERIPDQLRRYQAEVNQFINQVSNNFIKIHIREDYKSCLNGYLNNTHFLQISDICQWSSVPQVFKKLKEVYEKEGNRQKNQNIHSTESYLGRSILSIPTNHARSHLNLKAKQQQNENFHTISYQEPQSSSYNSVSNQIKQLQYSSVNSQIHSLNSSFKKKKKTENSEHRRRSASRGKGLELIHMNSMLIANEIHPNSLMKNNRMTKKLRVFKPMQIHQPIEMRRQLNQTAIIRKSDFL